MGYVKVGWFALVIAGALAIHGLSRPLGNAAVAVVEVSEAPAALAGPYRAKIVVDPGHGGSNLGAPTVHDGLYEKHVTMTLASELVPRLQAQGFEVILTRDADTYVSLRQRTAIANEIKADLLVSLHANATETHSQRGFETFVLTPDALDIDARALRVASPSSVTMSDAMTQRIVDDVQRGLAHVRAGQTAKAIQKALRQVHGPRHDRGVRQGGQHVLLGANMPAVLVEIGFVDHPIEGEQILAPEMTERIADALSRAIGATLAGA